MNHSFLSWMKFLLTLVGAAAAGIFIGSIALTKSVDLNLPRDNWTTKTLGVKRPEIIGFLPYWLLGKADNNYQDVLTNWTYFGLQLNGDGSLVQKLKPTETEPGWNKLDSDEVARKLLQAKNDQWQTSLLLQSSSNAVIDELVSNPDVHARKLVSETLPLMKQYGFTDLNLDIESFRRTDVATQSAFTKFVAAVKKELNAQAPEIILSIELTPASLVQPHLLEPAAIGAIADRVILMAYDFSYRGSYVAGPVAPINGVQETREYDVETSIQAALKQIPARKLILGIPLYGYEWDTLSREPYAPVVPNTGKTATQRSMDELLKTCVHCIKLLDPISQQPYVIQPTTETGYTIQTYYEDEESLAKKLELAKKYKLRGVALWAVGYETDKMLDPLRTYKKWSILE